MRPPKVSASNPSSCAMTVVSFAVQSTASWSLNYNVSERSGTSFTPHIHANARIISVSENPGLVSGKIFGSHVRKNRVPLTPLKPRPNQPTMGIQAKTMAKPPQTRPVGLINAPSKPVAKPQPKQQYGTQTAAARGASLTPRRIVSRPATTTTANKAKPKPSVGSPVVSAPTKVSSPTIIGAPKRKKIWKVPMLLEAEATAFVKQELQKYGDKLMRADFADEEVIAFGNDDRLMAIRQNNQKQVEALRKEMGRVGKDRTAPLAKRGVPAYQIVVRNPADNGLLSLEFRSIEGGKNAFCGRLWNPDRVKEVQLQTLRVEGGGSAPLEEKIRRFPAISEQKIRSFYAEAKVKSKPTLVIKLPAEMEEKEEADSGHTTSSGEETSSDVALSLEATPITSPNLSFGRLGRADARPNLVTSKEDALVAMESQENVLLEGERASSRSMMCLSEVEQAKVAAKTLWEDQKSSSAVELHEHVDIDSDSLSTAACSSMSSSLGNSVLDEALNALDGQSTVEELSSVVVIPPGGETTPSPAKEEVAQTAPETTAQDGVSSTTAVVEKTTESSTTSGTFTSTVTFQSSLTAESTTTSKSTTESSETLSSSISVQGLVKQWNQKSSQS